MQEGTPDIPGPQPTADLERTLSALAYLLSRPQAHDRQISLAEVDVHADWVGHPLRHLERASGARVAFLTRYGDGVLPDDQTVLQENDVVHVLVRAATLPEVERILTHAPEVTE